MPHFQSPPIQNLCIRCSLDLQDPSPVVYRRKNRYCNSIKIKCSMAIVQYYCIYACTYHTVHNQWYGNRGGNHRPHDFESVVLRFIQIPVKKCNGKGGCKLSAFLSMMFVSYAHSILLTQNLLNFVLSNIKL